MKKNKPRRERRVIKPKELEVLRAFLFSQDALNTSFVLKRIENGKDVECPLFRIYQVKVHPRLHAYFQKLLREHNIDFDAYFSWCVRHACNIIPHILVGDYFVEQRWTKGKKYGIPILPSYEEVQEPSEEECIPSNRDYKNKVTFNRRFAIQRERKKRNARKHNPSS